MARRFLITLILLLSIISVHAQDATPEATPEPVPAGYDSWQQVLDEARGTTLDWYMWGGSDAINEFVDTFYGDILAEEYGITLNRVPVADAVDAVNLVISEAEAGITDDGAVDAIWINGENFFTLKQADLLYADWAESIPNAALVDWENPAIAFDFGVPVEQQESPWSSAQLHFIYDSARLSEEDLPRNFDELTQYIEDNPGRVTYIAPGPGAFQGTRFVKQVLYHVSGGVDQWLGEWNADLYAEQSPALWELLNEWEPNLWREGETYPATENELHQLFANGEVDFTLTQAPAGAGPLIESGLLPPTARAFSFDEYMIGDHNYVTIPSNAADKAAALVLANLLLEPASQARHILPETGFGLGYAIDLERVSDDEREILQASLDALGDAAADAERLQAAFAPDMAPESQAIIEGDWEQNVLLGD